MAQKFNVMVGRKDGMYEIQSREAMKVVAFTVYGGVVYQGQGDDREEALYDLALRLDNLITVPDFNPEEYRTIFLVDE